MASKKKKDFSGTIVTMDDNGEIVQTTPKESKVTVSKVNSNTSNMVSKPTVESKQSVTIPTINTPESARRNYNEKLTLFNQANEALKNKRIEELNKNNIDLKNRFQYIDFKDNIKDGVVNKKTPQQREREFEEFEPELARLTQAEGQKAAKLSNDLELARYQKDLAEVEAKDPNLFEQIITPLTSGIDDIFSARNRAYIDENGNRIFLPSRSDLEYQKVRESYGDGFLGDLARFGGDVGHELSKQAVVAGLDKLTWGVGGKALYFTDIVSDQYRQNINEGYDKDQALADALLKGGSNFIKQRILGGLGGKLTGDTSWLENNLTNTFAKYVNNPRVVSMLSSMGSEAVDEFTDTYVEAGIDALVLGKKTDFDDLFLDSLYSAAVGAGTGGAGGAFNVSPEAQMAVYNQQQNRINQNTNQNVQPTVENTPQVEQAPTITETPQIETKSQENTNTQPKVEQQQLDLNENETKPIENKPQTTQEKTQPNKKETTSELAKVAPNKETKTSTNGEREKQRKLDSWKGTGLYSNISKEQYLKNNYYPSLEQEIGLTREQAGEWFDNSKTKEYKSLNDKMNELYRDEQVKRAIPMEDRGNLVFDAYDKNLKYSDMEQNLIKAVNDRVNKFQEDNKDRPEWTKTSKGVIEHAFKISGVFDNTSRQMTPQQKLDFVNNVLEMGGYDTINQKQFDSYQKQFAPTSKVTSKQETKVDAKKQKVADNAKALNLEKAETKKPTKKETKQEVKPKKENTNLAERKTDDVVKATKEQTSKEITDDLNNIIEGKEVKESRKKPKKEDFESIKQDIEKDTGKKMRGFIETATEAEKTTDLIRAMDKDKITYEQQSNKKTVQEAQNGIKDLNYAERVQKARDIFDSDKRIKATDIATLHLVAQEARDSGDYDTYNELTEYRAILETELGQSVQAAAIIQNSDPLTQLDTLKKIIKREQRKGNKVYKGVVIDEDLVNAVRQTYDEKTGKYDKTKFNKAMDNLKQSIADQMHVGIGEKLNAWRYLSMLGNPKTHIRNVVANVAMTMLQGTKNRVAAGIESLTPDAVLNAENRFFNRIYGEKKTDATRGKTVKFASKDVKNYARQAINDYFSDNKQTSKYNESSNTLKKDLEQRRKIWSNKHPLGLGANALNKANNFLLNWEDNFFSKGVARRSMQNFLSANGIETKADIEAHPELMEQALDYAIFKGEEATFHQYSRTGEAIRGFKDSLKRGDNKLSRKLGKGGSILSKGAGLVADSVMPFVNTPINIAKTGIEYTPVLGLFKSLGSDVRNAPSDLKADVFIDGLSKRFAGGMLAALGYGLASMGRIKGKSGKEKEEKLEADLGQQDYSVKIGDNTYDLSWLSPTAMPFFVGVELYNAVKKDDIKLDVNTAIDALANTLDPLSEMSVISSMADTMKTYSNDSNARAILYNVISSYLSQYIPTLSGQMASAFDDKQRQYKNSGESLPETIYNQARYKIPGARNTLPEKVDVWGNTKNNVSPIESFFSPANRKEYRVDETTKALEELERRTSDTQTSVLPTIKGSSATATIDKHKYAITGEALSEYKETWGKTAKSEVDKMLNSSDFKNADDETKEKMIKALYDYATYRAKKEYADDNNIDYSDDNKYAMVDAFNIPYDKLEGMRLTDLSKKEEKQEAIDNSNLTLQQKDMINLIQNYKYYEADVDALINKINNSNLSKSQKEKLIAKIKDNSTKGGKKK